MNKNPRIAVVASSFNRNITRNLWDCCRRELLLKGIKPQNIFIFWVPGAYELPLAAKRLARTKKYAVIICLGCIIKGETSHDEYIANWASIGIGLTSLLTGVPCLFGVLTPKTEAQALKRSRPGPLNRGKEMADAALDMIQLMASRS